MVVHLFSRKPKICVLSVMWSAAEAAREAAGVLVRHPLLKDNISLHFFLQRPFTQHRPFPPADYHSLSYGTPTPPYTMTPDTCRTLAQLQQMKKITLLL